MSDLVHQAPQHDAVLSKAVLKASDQLGLKRAELAAVLGVHRTAVSRLGQKPLKPESKEGELALMLIRIARAVYALTAGDEAWAKHFMRTRNTVTGGVPAEQIQSIQGLMSVLQFVDAIRGKV